jgi:YfiH family protein
MFDMLERSVAGPLPLPAPAFEWLDAPAGPALVCRPLATVAPHIFTTREWPLGAPAAAAAGDDDGRWADVARAVGVGITSLGRLRQVHGSEIANAETALAGMRPAADIIVSADPAVAAAVQAADCVPLLVADARTGAVATVHAGWRGMVARAPERAIAALTDRFGSAPGDLFAALGPSIGACCYEVGADVLSAFRAAGFDEPDLSRWFLTAPQASARNPSMLRPSSEPRSGRWFFVGSASVRDRLVAAGLTPARIFGAELCTASHSIFCSYRRDRSGAGRMAAAIRSGGRRP